MSDVKTEAGFRKFLIIWMGEWISNIGTGMTAFGLGVYVWQLTGSALDVAMVELAALLPLILLTPVAGVLADRYDRRLLMALGDSISGLGLLIMLLLMMSGHIQVWQICLCVGFSSAFSSLLDPAYKATLTDLLTEEEYARASGMVGIASASKFLISPILGGLILAWHSMELILVIDILTLVVTVVAILMVRRSLKTRPTEKKELDFLRDLKEGWQVIAASRGVMLLIVLVSVLVFYMGILQVLARPMLLSFASEQTTGILQTVVACGMLVSSMLIGGGLIRKNLVNVMVASFVAAGITMAGFGATTSIPVITVAGFLFFASLPFANTSIEVLIRTSIANDKQGRAWGLISLISQLGYIVAYVFAGVLADYVFNPALKEGGVLADTVGRVIGTGETRGIGLLIMLSGLGLVITALLISRSQGLRALEARE